MNSSKCNNKCRVLIFNDHLYYIIQFILLSSIDHISITSTLIDGFFLVFFSHITHCIRHSLIMFTLWNLAPLFSLDTPPHTMQHRSLLHSLAYYLAHINLFNYDIIGIPVSYFLYTLSQYCGKSLAAMHHCPANQSL